MLQFKERTTDGTLQSTNNNYGPDHHSKWTQKYFNQVLELIYFSIMFIIGLDDQGLRQIYRYTYT